MIIEKVGDIFTSECDVLVNPTNSIGIMGKGLAKEFKIRYPKSCNDFNAKSFNNFNNQKLISPMIYFEGGKYLLMFPTKIHWRKPSQYSYIQDSLEASLDILEGLDCPSIAFPAIGCGNGGLNRYAVLEILRDKFRHYDNTIEFYK